MHVVALFGNNKAENWVSGRRNWYSNLENKLASNKKPVIWIHASSTGEFEQGRTVIDGLRKAKGDYFFLLTFFSPSGFLQHKDYEEVNAVYYLPLDSKSNANEFLNVVNPKIAIFIKYEFWYFYFKGLAKREIPLFLVSAKLTKNHLFFKWYGKSYRKVLQHPSLFFVQDESTNALLKELGVDNVMVTGDTRIDRVLEVASLKVSNSIVEEFLENEKAIIVGSSWSAEEKIVIEWLNSGVYSGKIIIAPHEINEQRIQSLVNSLQVKTIRYTHADLNNIEPEGQVLIIDCIGILKDLYKYGSWAFIGGGFSDGIHNILEPAVFGLPVIFGPKYKKFSEAVDLIELGGAFSISSFSAFNEHSEKLNDPKILMKRSKVCKSYIEQNQGASLKVVKQINQYL